MNSDPRDQKPGPEFGQDFEAVRSAWNGLEKTEPPDLLDQAVLNAARRELKGQRRRGPIRWLGAFATAAVVVLALTIVVQQDERPLIPAEESFDDIMLNPVAPAKRRNEMDKDAPELKAERSQSSGQFGLEGGERAEARLKRSAEPAAVPPVAAEGVDEPLALDEDIPAIAPEMEMLKKADEFDQAGAWVDRLLQLRETGQDEQFATELAAFREVYPDYPLPPELVD